MLRALLLFALIAIPADAAERRVAIGSFDRVRIDGPFEVHIDTGRSPGGTIAGDPSAIETVELRTDGNTLVIRRGIGGWAEQHRAAPTAPIVVRLGTIDLAGALVVAGGTLSVTRMRGDRIDLSVTGAGSIVVGEASGDSLNATVIGAGTIGIAGRTGRARLVTNGTGTIDAAALDAGELFVRLDGPGAIQARAHYTATVDDVGLGRVTVLGDPKCTVRAAAGGPVTCGPAQ
ncbi:GIN domain-containing protein [Sphingomonas bacterium]|uniref:GIN domain-containing protein n=1 Tax=Sphingomonas bacterium TaxID=1895847 RepID=UPI0015754BD6|nr:DUF2807 domain-containing protein [Sphingomonas bacterium]